MEVFLLVDSRSELAPPTVGEEQGDDERQSEWEVEAEFKQGTGPLNPGELGTFRMSSGLIS